MKKSFARIYSSSRSLDKVFVPFNTPRECLSVVDVDFEGRSIPTSKYVVDDPSTRYDGMKPSDFALENQSKIGVPPKLALCSLQTNEIEREIDRVNNMSFEVKNSDN